MAENTAFRNNALPYPVYGVPYTIVLPILDADGDGITDGTINSLVSINGDTEAAGATPVEIGATCNYYLLLTAAQMTADIVSGSIGSTTSGAKRTAFVIYPRKLVQLATGTSQGGAAGYITLAASTVGFNGQFNGCLCVATIDTLIEARILQVCTASNQQCTVTPGWNVAPDADDTYIIYLPEGVQYPTANVMAIYNALQTAVPGAANGLTIAGSNAATTFATLTSTGAFTCGSTVLGATTMGTLTQTGAVSWGATTFASVTCTGALTVSNGIIVTCSTTNRSAVSLTGNGTGHGLLAAGGTGLGGASAFRLNAGGSSPAIDIRGDSAEAVRLIGASGATALQVTAGISGTAIYVTGAVRSIDASNDIVGIDLAKIAGSAAAATGLAGIFDYVGTCRIVGSPTSSQIQLGADADDQDNFYNGAVAKITGGTGANQARRIGTTPGDYDGATRIGNLDSPWVTPPDATSTVIILGRIIT